MQPSIGILYSKKVLPALTLLPLIIVVMSSPGWAQTPPEPVVAIHVSELTQALEAMPNAWWTSWHYFVAYESLEEALRSDGTPFVEVTDANIAGGSLLYADGSPRYPIVLSLASEAVASNEIAPLRAYVAAGGFLFVGSSSFTRNPDGSARDDFALASEMGLHMVTPNSLQNWYENIHFSKVLNHRLAAGIPAGTLSWRMPLTSEEIPLGTVSPYHSIHGNHYVFDVTADNGTAVIANGDSGPLLTTRPYGNGNFIYHGAAQPLIGHTVYDPSMYAYLIYRHAIEWAFEAANLPIIKLSPMPYEYNAAFIVRHDFENDADSIRSIESSALFDYSHGAKSDYYFCTGTLREEMPDEETVVAGLKRAVTNYGATIGSHNGGLKNPVSGALSLGDFDYWHWGPDEALDVAPPGYPSGKAYAESSILESFQDIEGWLAGTDNGRPGCGSADNCPRTWTAPYMNSTREASFGILEDLGVVSTGEQKIGPFPTWALSTQTAGKRYPYISVPASGWYVGNEIPGSLEIGHTAETIQAAVDFYYTLGALINLYGHIPSSDTNLMGQYVEYCATKDRMWPANAVGLYDWWKARSNANAVFEPSYSVAGSTADAQAAITGATDPDAAIEVEFPGGNVGSNLQVFLDGAPADPTSYRTFGNAVKIQVGSSTSVEVRYTIDSAVDRITISPSSSSITAGGSQVYTAEAFDQNNISLGDVTASTTFTIGPDGSCTGASCTATVTGTHTVTGTYGGKTSSATLQVSAGVLDHFEIAPIGPQTVLTPFTITVTAKDSFSNTAGSFTGTVALSTTAGTISPTSSGSFSGGAWTGSVQVTSAGADMTITAQAKGKTGTSNPFDVNISSSSFVRIDGLPPAYYGTLQDAFAAAVEGDTIQAQEITPAEDLNFNPGSAISITFDGGYNADFTSPIGYTTMNSMSISGGTVTVDRLIIQ